jgi:Cu-Zn family superoxide dismutase
MMETLFRTFVGFLWLLSNLPTPVAGVDTYIATATLLTSQPATVPSVQYNVIGTITFTQKAGENKVDVTGRLTLGSDFLWTGNTSIGFHVHTTSNFTTGCDSAGSHYNPENKNHGGPTDSTRHVGDLGNVVFDAGTRMATVQMTDSVITLVGKHTIVGRSLVLHKGTDDLGKGGTNDSLTTGNSGGRYACGAIVIASDFSPSSATDLITGGYMMIMCLIGLFSVALQKMQW